MTTEAAAHEQAARLEALRQRRATTGNRALGFAAPTPPAESTRRSPPSPRRRHAATGARILAGSLSAATALALVGIMAGGFQGGSTAPTRDATPTSPSSPVLILVAGSGQALEGTTSGPITAAPRVTPSVAVAAATSQAS